MKIIEDGRAPNPRRVRIFLAEKGISIPFEQLDMMKAEHKSSEFSQLNPWQRLPVLVLDDGSVLGETVAICRYFEEIQPEPSLLGRGALGKAVTEMWNRRVELGLFFHIAQHFRHLHPRMAPFEVPQIATWGEANKPKVEEQLTLLDRELAGRAFIAGSEFSIADITALAAIDFMKPARLEIPAGLANLGRWHSEVSARPSAAA